MSSPVTRTPAADSARALAHFEDRLGFETDCWDVHQALEQARLGEQARDFVLVDVRGPDLYQHGHLPDAVNLPHGRIVRGTVKRLLGGWPADTLIVVYCAGPHCNGASKAALRLARLGHPVKEMIGGVTGWLDEGFALDTQPSSRNRARASS